MYIDSAKLESIKPEVEANQILFDQMITKIKGHADENDSPFQKLVAYHDCIVMNYNYDWDGYMSDNPGDKKNNILYFISDKTGQCEVFSMLFNYLAMDIKVDSGEGNANPARLETGFITSYENGMIPYHTWNIIKVKAPGSDRECWYHVDVTWDENSLRYYQEDPSVKMGKTVYDFSFLGDERITLTHEMPDENIYFKNNIGQTDNSLDDAEWRKTGSQIAVVGDKIYYIASALNNGMAELKMYDSVRGVCEVLYSYEANWSVKDGCAYSGLAMIDEKLYFNDAVNIYTYNINNGLIGQINTSVSRAVNDEIYACYRDGDDVMKCIGICDENNQYTPDAHPDYVLPELDCLPMPYPIVNVAGNAVTVSFGWEKALNGVVFVKHGGSIAMEHTDGQAEVSVEIPDLENSDNAVKVFVWTDNMVSIRNMETVYLE